MRRSLSILILMLAVTLTGCGLLNKDATTPTPDATEAAAPSDATPPTGAAQATPTPDAETLAQGLQAETWTERLAVAWTISERDDIAVDERVDLLMAGLEHEVAVPSQGAPPVGAYLASGPMMRLQFGRRLAELGPEAAPHLRDAVENAQGEARQHALVALAYLGEEDVIPQVRELLRTAKSPVVRMDAARALGEAGATEAIPDLTAALDDPVVIQATGDTGPYTIYPVREQAAGALIKLGVNVERDGDTFTVEGE
jgi:HEAT repeat protein